MAIATIALVVIPNVASHKLRDQSGARLTVRGGQVVEGRPGAQPSCDFVNEEVYLASPKPNCRIPAA